MLISTPRFDQDWEDDYVDTVGSPSLYRVWCLQRFQPPGLEDYTVYSDLELRLSKAVAVPLLSAACVMRSYWPDFDRPLIILAEVGFGVGYELSAPL